MPINRIYQPYIVTKGNKLALPKDATYFRFAARETCLAREEAWLSWLVDQGVKSVVDIPNGHIYDYYLEEQSAYRTYTKIAKYIETNWHHHIGSYRKRQQRLTKTSLALSRAAVEKDRNKILKAFIEYVQSSYQFSEYIMGAWAVIYNFEPIILDKLKNHLEIINSLEQPIEYFAMQLALLQEPLPYVLKHYGWLKVYSPTDDPYTLPELKKLKSSLNKKHVLAQQKKFRVTAKKFQALLKSIKDKQLRLQTQIVHTYAFLKTDRVDVWRRAMFNLRPFYEYLAELSDTTLSQAVNFSISQAEFILKNNKAPGLKYKPNSDLSLYFFTQGTIRVVNNRKEIKNILTRLEGQLEDTKSFSGTSACPGKVTGSVKIITHSTHLKKIKPGDIFVAKYTFPNFTPAMVKSAAIVTDEGGLTSHAAIVAREFGIPCIIATKIATRALKDGDKVEVDADQGTVRKI